MAAFFRKVSCFDNLLRAKSLVFESSAVLLVRSMELIHEGIVSVRLDNSASGSYSGISLIGIEGTSFFFVIGTEGMRCHCSSCLISE